MNKILYIHVGKTGGTTVATALNSAKMPYFAVHVYSAERYLFAMFNTVVVSLRDPVERAISAYYWNSPLTSQLSAASRSGPRWHEFYSCCPSINDYSAALSSSEKCGAVARLGYEHTEWNLCSMLGGVVDELSTHGNVWVIEEESLLDDVNRVVKDTLPDLDIGVRTQFTQENFFQRNNYNKSKIASAPISDESLVKLRGYLEITGEYWLYRRLLAIAVNK